MNKVRADCSTCELPTPMPSCHGCNVITSLRLPVPPFPLLSISTSANGGGHLCKCEITTNHFNENTCEYIMCFTVKHQSVIRHLPHAGRTDTSLCCKACSLCFFFFFFFFFYSKAMQQIWKSPTWCFASEVKVTFFPPSFLLALQLSLHLSLFSFRAIFCEAAVCLHQRSLSWSSYVPGTISHAVTGVTAGHDRVHLEACLLLGVALNPSVQHSARPCFSFFFRYSRRTSLQVFISRGRWTILPRT